MDTTENQTPETPHVPEISVPDDPGTETVNLIILSRLTKDLKKAAALMTPRQIRYVVDGYYALQEFRKSSANQVRALEKSGEPHGLIEWLEAQMQLLEDGCRGALTEYSRARVVGRWAEGIYGIGPVLSAGLLAHIDLEPWTCMVHHYDLNKKPCTEKEPHKDCCRRPLQTVGQIWRFGGQDPTVEWEEHEKRPWNASLKTLIYKIGESFVKFCNKDEDVYGKVYVKRKELEWSRNLSGLLGDQAKAMLERKKFKQNITKRWYSGEFDPGVVRRWLQEGNDMLKLPAAEAGRGVAMLPPGHIHSRARRYAAKLFLSHWHEAAYFDRYHRLPPRPYVIEKLGHAHLLAPPNQGAIEGWAEARKRAGI